MSQYYTPLFTTYRHGMAKALYIPYNLDAILGKTHNNLDAILGKKTHNNLDAILGKTHNKRDAIFGKTHNKLVL